MFTRSQVSRNGVKNALKHAKQCRRYASTEESSGSSGPSPATKRNVLLGLGVVGAAGFYAVTRPAAAVKAEAAPAPAEMRFEKKKPKTKNVEDYKDTISSQHLQVKKSWESPGVYAWGSNTGLVVAPESNEPAVKTPKRFHYFDGMVLRDLKMDRNYAAAVTENGDVLQWGIDYSTDFPGPIKTLTGKNIKKISLTKDSIIALSKNGQVYNLPVRRDTQLAGPKPSESSSIPFWNGKSPISYATINPPNLGFGEKVTDISAGREHCILLTSAGRMFSAATSSDYPAKGQLGIPDLVAPTVPAAEVTTHPVHEINMMGAKVSEIASGDYHSVCVDDHGRIYAWGDNSAGQLGFEPVPGQQHIDAPSMLPIDKLYVGTSQRPFVTGIAAGGNSTVFSVDAKEPKKVSADVWACGQGIYGTLGNGKWTHVQGVPTKIKALSGMSEYNEQTNTVSPIRLSHMSVGATHASAQMDNVTNVDVGTSKDPKYDTNFGADILFWGGNEFYQLGTGRRNNLNTPSYIAPLDAVERDVKKTKEGADSGKRFQITPRKKIDVGGKKMEVEQRVVCGRGVTGVFSAVPRD